MEPPTKQKKTAQELTTMIREDLGKMDGCPKRGVTVTVYGLNPWNAMLSFGADAGPVPNKAELNRFFEIVIERLKRLYDVGALARAAFASLLHTRDRQWYVTVPVSTDGAICTSILTAI